MIFCRLLTFFQNELFRKILSETLIRVTNSLQGFTLTLVNVYVDLLVFTHIARTA